MADEVAGLTRELKLVRTTHATCTTHALLTVTVQSLHLSVTTRYTKQPRLSLDLARLATRSYTAVRSRTTTHRDHYIGHGHWPGHCYTGGGPAAAT